MTVNHNGIGSSPIGFDLMEYSSLVRIFVLQTKEMSSIPITSTNYYKELLENVIYYKYNATIRFFYNTKHFDMSLRDILYRLYSPYTFLLAKTVQEYIFTKTIGKKTKHNLCYHFKD